MPKKRHSLAEMHAAVEAAKAATTSAPATVDPTDMVTTAIHIPRRVLSLLRRVAVARADRQGGRPSVSGVLAALVLAHEAELTREIQ